MANWSPVAGQVLNYVRTAADSSGPASGYVLKFYDTTNVAISMASASDGSGLLGSCTIDSSGYPLNGSGARFIPFVDQDYRPALYTNQTDADADTIANADWFPGTVLLAFIGDLSASSGSSLVGYISDVAGAVETTVQARLREEKTVSDFGTLGGADDSPTIRLAIDWLNANTNSTLIFPKRLYNISEGFILDGSDAILDLNGSIFQATTTFAQSLTSGATNNLFKIGSESTGVLVDNIKIFGGGAIFDGRRDEQTGTVPGYTGITIRPYATTASLSDRLNITNIEIHDLTLDSTGFDGMWVGGCKGLKLFNVKCLRSYRLGMVLVDIVDCDMHGCEFSYTLGTITTSGAGMWNECNETWQEIYNVRIYDSRADYNESSGFIPYNAGPGSVVDIELHNCTADHNVITPASLPAIVYRIDPSESGFRIAPPEASPSFYAGLIGCSSSRNSGRGLYVLTTVGTTVEGTVVVKDFASFEDNGRLGTGTLSSSISIENTGGFNVKIKDPVVINKVNYTAGAFGITTLVDATNVEIERPRVYGQFTASEAIVYSGVPAARLAGGKIAAILGGDINKDIVGASEEEFFEPVRPPSFDGATDPAVADMIEGEIVSYNISATDSHIVRVNKGGSGRYLSERGKARLRGSAANTIGLIAAGSVGTQDITVTGAAITDICSVSSTAAIGSLSATCHCQSADTVRVVVNNNTAGGLTPTGSWIVNVDGNE